MKFLSKNADIIFWGALGFYALFILKNDTARIIGTICISTAYILHRMDKNDDGKPSDLD